MSKERGSFNKFMEDKFIPAAAKFGAEKHLVAIRDAFIAIMPLTMVGSVATLLNVFFRNLPTAFGADWITTALAPLISINGNAYFGTLTVLSLALAFTLGYNLSKAYGVNQLAGGLISFASLVSTFKQTAEFSYTLPGVGSESLEALQNLGLSVTASGESLVLGGVSGSGYIPTAFTSSSGMFSAIIVGFVSTLVYIFLMKHKVIIKLPDTVPPAVSNAFAAIIPGIAAVYVASIAEQLCVSLSDQTINELITVVLQAPLLRLSSSFGTVILVTFLVQLFWFFGLHGANIMAPVLESVYVIALNENMNVYQATQSTADLPYLWTRSSFNAYAWMGGAGLALGLLIAILLFSKREDQRTVAKLSLPMGIFNINEPVIFGIPIVLNAVYLIPWLIVTPICAAIGYIATAIGLVPPTFVTVPWIMPVGIYAFMATGGSLMAALISIINLVISVAIYAPFVKAANRMKIEE